MGKSQCGEWDGGKKTGKKKKMKKQRRVKLRDTIRKCWRVCVCSTLTHLCWWCLRFVNGGHPTPDISWISGLPGNLCQPLSILFLHLYIIFLPFHDLFCYQGLCKWGLNVFLKVSVTEETSSTHTLASFTWCWWVEPCGWRRKFTTREPSLCRHVCLHAHTQTHTQTCDRLQWYAKFISLEQNGLFLARYSLWQVCCVQTHTITNHILITCASTCLGMCALTKTHILHIKTHIFTYQFIRYT